MNYRVKKYSIELRAMTAVYDFVLTSCNQWVCTNIYALGRLHSEIPKYNEPQIQN